MAQDKSTKSKKPINYYYNPYYKLDGEELQFLDVWQVLEDDVLGSLYPWQYVATAEMSNRIVTLNFLALKNFENDYRKYYDQMFVYKVSAKLLSEGNVHRLGSIIQSNLILCFDIYQLEKFGDKASLAGLRFLQNIGATIMISGVDKAPVDVLLKYTAQYYLLDYRYYNDQNKGLVTMIKQLANTNAVTLVVGNVNNKDNLKIFTDNGIEIFSGSAIGRPKKSVSKFVKASEGEQEEETASKFIVKDVESPEVKERAKKVEVEQAIDEVTLNVTSTRDAFRAKLAKAAQSKAQAKKEKEQKKLEPIEEITISAADLEVVEDKKKEEKPAKELRKPRNAPLKLNTKKEEKKVEAKSQKKEEPQIKEVKKEANNRATNLGAGAITTSTDEFASLNKNKQTKKATRRGENVIKLNLSKPKKKR